MAIHLLFDIPDPAWVQPLRMFGTNLFPAISAAGFTVRQGIAEFSGRPLNRLGPAEIGSVYAVLSVMFVFLPTLYLYFRHGAQQPFSERNAIRWVLVFASTVLAAILLLYSVTVAATYYASASVYPQLKQESELNIYETSARELTAVVAFKAQEFAARSAAHGGGGGLFRKERGVLTLSDLGVNERVTLGRFILIPQQSDTVLRLLFIGNRPFPSSSMTLNAPSSTVILDADIYPSFHRITAVR
jgi:hypothetical protein